MEFFMFSSMRSIFGGGSKSSTVAPIAGPSKAAQSKPVAQTKTTAAAAPVLAEPRYFIDLSEKSDQPGFFIPEGSVRPGVAPNDQLLAVTNFEGKKGFVRKTDVVEVNGHAHAAYLKRAEALKMGRTQEDINRDVDALLAVFLDGQLIIPQQGCEDEVESKLKALLESEEVDCRMIYFNHETEKTFIIPSGFEKLFNFIVINKDVVKGFCDRNAKELLASFYDEDYLLFVANLKAWNFYYS